MVRSRSWRPLLAAAVALAGFPCAAWAKAPQAAPEALGGLYIVELADPAVATYRGGVDGIPATSPAVTRRPLDPGSAAARAWRGRLADTQDAVIARAERRAGSTIEVRRSYRYATAGFAAKLDGDELAALARDPAVAAITPNTALELEDVDPVADPVGALTGTAGAPQAAQLLGLPAGLWSALGGPTSASGAGSGRVIGIVDTGLDPGLPAFAASPAGAYAGDPFPAPPASFTGTCQAPAPGEPVDAAFTCSNKVVGARWFLSSWAPADLASDERRSARDVGGHGTHVAGIAAGNYGVDPDIAGMQVMSGIAPRAHVAVYKVCWRLPSGDAPCGNVEILAAFDALVTDGVREANISIGSTFRALPGVMAKGILALQEAGVAIAQSAGNSGASGTNTVGFQTANWWALATGATSGAGTAAATNGGTRAEITTSAPSLPVIEDVGVAVGPVPTGVTNRILVDAGNHVAAGRSLTEARQCQTGALSSVPSGAIVLCDRGTVSFAVKADAVAAAGGGVMLVANNVVGTINPASGSGAFPLPVLAITLVQGMQLRTAIGSGTLTASIRTPIWGPRTPDDLAAFSSRGPVALLPSVMGVSVSAPGDQILSSYPTSLAPTGWTSLNGTSMASPAVAGALVLLRQRHPTRTPDELRSALVTTGRPVTIGLSPAGPHAAGGGRIDPQAADDPGLVVVAGDVETGFRAALRGADPGEADRDLGPTADGEDAPTPYVMLRELAGPRTVKRLVRSVASEPASWSVAVPSAAGWAMTVSPSSFTLVPGESRELSITAVPSGSPAEMTGAITLTDGGTRTLRLPVGLRAVTSQAAPQAVLLPAVGAAGSGVLTGAARSTAWQATTASTPLVPDTLVESFDFPPAPSATCNPADAGSVRTRTIDVPPGATGLVARTVNPRSPAAQSTDVDIHLVAPGGGETRAETFAGVEAVGVASPAPGTWTIRVVACSTGAGYDLRAAVIGSSGAAVSVPLGPTDVPPGVRHTAPVAWSGLTGAGDHVAVASTSGSGAATQVLVVERRAAPSASVEVGFSGGVARVTGSAAAGGVPTWLRASLTRDGATTRLGPLRFLGAGSAPVDLALGSYGEGAGGTVTLSFQRRGVEVASVAVPFTRPVTPAPPGDPPAPPADPPPGGTSPLPPPSVVQPSVPSVTPTAASCAQTLARGTRAVPAAFGVSRSSRTVRVRIRARSALGAVRVALRRPSPCRATGAALASSSVRTIRRGRSVTVTLRLPARSSSAPVVLVVDARAGKRATRFVQAVPARR